MSNRRRGSPEDGRSIAHRMNTNPATSVFKRNSEKNAEPKSRPGVSPGQQRCATGIELRPRCNASHDSLNLDPNRNLNLPRDFGSKSKSKITIKNFAKCVNWVSGGSNRGRAVRDGQAPPQAGERDRIALVAFRNAAMSSSRPMVMRR